MLNSINQIIILHSFDSLQRSRLAKQKWIPHNSIFFPSRRHLYADSTLFINTYYGTGIQGGIPLSAASNSTSQLLEAAVEVHTFAAKLKQLTPFPLPESDGMDYD